LAFGTDYPVVSYNPFFGLSAAVSRRDGDGKPAGINPEESISLEKAFKAYTIEAAKAYGMEDSVGTLEEGKLADIAVIDRNLFELEPMEIRKCSVVMTIMDGRIVFRA
jgi:predicted amidohydrolase YtcJ